jgi:hypothetical protein
MDQPLRAVAPGEFDQLVELLARVVAAARCRDGEHRSTGGQRLGEDAELEAAGHVGKVDQLHPEPDVGLVGAVPRHRLGVRQPREGLVENRPIRHDLAADRDRRVLDCGHHIGLADEAHFQVELRELRLSVAARVLVAVAARQLVVAVIAGDHEQLLHLLRALREGVELAGLLAAGHHEVARALRRASDQRRRLDIGEALGLERSPNRTVQTGAQQDSLLKRRTAKVQVPMLQAQRLIQPGLLLVDVERRHLRWIEDGEPIHGHLDRTGRQLRVAGPLGTRPHDALDLHHPLVAGRLGGGVRISRFIRIRHHLRDAVPVAQIEEGEVAVIASPVDPTGQRNALAGVLGAQLAAGMGTEGGAHGSVNGSRSPAPIMARRP